MTGHMTSFFSTQLDVPSIGMLVNLHILMQCSYSSFLHLCFSLSPTLGTKLCCIMALFVNGHRVKLEVKTETRHIKFWL